MAELRRQLAQAVPVTAEARQLQDRLAAESREKAALEEAIRTSQAAYDARNRELEAKIDQLGQLIDKLHSGAPAAVPSPVALPTQPAGKPPIGLAAWGARLRRVRAWRRQWPRAGVVAGGLGLLGLGLWGLSHLGHEAPVPYQENGRWGFAAPDGTPVVPARYSSVAAFQQARAVVETEGVYGMIDEAGKEVLPLAYDALNAYADGYARVRVGDAYTFVDERGREFDTYYFNALDFAEGRAAVLDHRGWHYLTGPEPEDPAKPPVIFREAYSFRNGLARVRLADVYTFISPDYLDDPAEGTAPFGRYESATDFEQGRAQVTQGGRSFFINPAGEPVE